MVVRWAAVCLVLVGVVAGCSDEEITKVVVDGDGAFDDVKAVVLLLEQPEIEVVAITVSGTGIAHCPVAAENMAALLERIDAPEIPVACGRTTPLEGDNSAPQAWRDAADNLGAVALPPPRRLAELAAPELLVETIRETDGLVLVALGPLTNVAEAIRADPSIATRIDMMYLMGGAVDVGGNVLYANPAAEFNIWADPTAAAEVFATEIPITLVPLDATNVVPVTPYLYDAVAAHRDASSVATFMADYLDATPLYGGMYHWDELAAVAAIDEAVVTLEERLLRIEVDGGPVAGATLEASDGRVVRVATDADPAAFEAHFYEAMIGTADPGIDAWKPDATITWDGTRCRYDGPDPMPSSMWVRIDNTSSDLIAWLTGEYTPGTTTADWDAYVASGATEPPDWWQQRGQIAVPGGAHDVWPVRAGSTVTGVCYVDQDRFWELAGPRISG